MTTTTAIIGLLAALTVLLTWVVYLLIGILHQLDRNLIKLENIYTAQLNPRTRLGHVMPDTGMPDPDLELRKVGREPSRMSSAPAFRTRVVGGDEDTELYKNLGGTTNA